MKTKIVKNPLDIFSQLNLKYKNTFNYLVSIKNVGCWIGATPELLAEFENNHFKTVALAGTKHNFDIEWSNKEKEEQQFVTDFIFNQLKNKVKNIKKSPIETLKAGEVFHLKTSFKGLINKNTDWTDIVNSLHPTPATCGLPKNKSQALINTIEPHQRNFYTGFSGIISPKHKLLMVNLRCMQIINNNAFLYLGGGITSKSNPEKEWEETINKSKTLLNVV
jgi:isochorismate synthase